MFDDVIFFRTLKIHTRDAAVKAGLKYSEEIPEHLQKKAVQSEQKKRTATSDRNASSSRADYDKAIASMKRITKTAVALAREKNADKLTVDHVEAAIHQHWCQVWPFCNET